jgi:uncharacterized protein YjbI with pentapeptide repeats
MKMRSFPGVLAFAFLIVLTFSPARAVSQRSARELNSAEKWVVARVTAGEEADLSQQFPADKDRKLSARFLEGLLMGALPGVKPHRNGVRIIGATIDEPIDLTNAQIPCEVWLEYCQFNKSVTFNRASFVGSVLFDDSTFKGDASFSGMKVGFFAFFRKAVFEGPVSFGYADIAASLVADEAQFKNKEQSANFNSVKVGDAAFFRKAVFEGPVDFLGADIASQFVAIGAQFQNKEKGASFNGMKVREYAFFNNAAFDGPVDFSYADFAWLDLSSASWPKAGVQFDMQGMRYKYMRAAPGNEPESHKALLKLADQSAYTADVYSNLEEFFLRQGYRGDADRAFIAGKRRERKENLTGFHWVGSFLLDWLVGYGRRPWQAGIPCVALVALGCVLFSPKKMEPQKPEDAPRVYSRFWYSLNLFLPVVDLQAGKVWKPKADQTFLRNYMRVHIMLGWILIPIVLAALTGLIK